MKKLLQLAGISESLNPGHSLQQTRRQFIVSASTVAGGLALGLSSCAKTEKLSSPTTSSDVSDNSNLPWANDDSQGDELNAWVEILPDNQVILRVPTPEIGNGSMTQVAMNVTEELACDWNRVKVEFCSIQRDYLDGGIYNSGFLPFFGGHGTDSVRMKYAMQLGASARERLIAAAAERWQVPASEIDAKNSVLTHSPSGKQLTYGEVAAEAAKLTLAKEPELKPESEWTFLGKASPAKINIPDIAAGKAVFGIDVKVPGMVHAALMQSPVHGGKLKSHKPEAVLGMPGVRKVIVVDPSKTQGLAAGLESKATWGYADNQVQSGVAVIADHYWQAQKALEALPVEWEDGEGAQWTNEDKVYDATRALLDSTDAKVLRESGDVTSVKGVKTVEGDYSTPYCENAMLEPLNGTAMVSNEGAEVWCPTQDMIQAYWVAIDETGLQPEQVKFNQTFVGGRFGRGTQADDVRMVVAVAKEYPGVPVKTIWSREECFHQARLRTPILTRFKAELGEDGYPEAFTSRASFVGTAQIFQMPLGFDDMPYFTSGIIPNVQISRNNYPINILNGAYRAPCYNSHAFFVETFIDECAVAAEIDPLEYRLHLMSKWEKSWSDCLRVAAEKSGWGEPLSKGEGRGIAISNWPAAAYRNKGSIICVAARVAVSQEGELHVKQLDVAFDCGKVANADAVRAQVEGGVLFGMNMTLNEQITIANGRVAESNYHQYPMLRLGDNLPTINVHFDALSGIERFDLMGEAPVGPIGPAIGNAIYDAIGVRLRSTPFRKHDLSWS